MNGSRPPDIAPNIKTIVADIAPTPETPNVDQLRIERDAAQARLQQMSKTITMLEQKVRELEAIARTPQPIAAAPQTCIEYKTLIQSLYPAEKLSAADKELAKHENEGWTLFNITTLDEATRSVIFKRIIPVASTRGTATAAAALTSPFVRETLDAEEDEQPITTFGELFKQYGVAESMNKVRAFAGVRAVNYVQSQRQQTNVRQLPSFAKGS